jgi:hypothetical protein
MPKGGKMYFQLRVAKMVMVLLVVTCATEMTSANLITLNPVADGYWKYKSGTTILDNNASGTLRVGREKITTSWYKDRGLFQFDLSGINLSLIESAVLKLTFINKYVQVGDPDLMLYRSDYDSWAESGTTLTGVPASGLPTTQLLDRKSGSPLTTNGQTFTWDLLHGTSPYTWETTSPWVPTDDADDQTLSLVLKISNNVTEEDSMTSQRYYNFYSKESATTTYHPVLELTVIPEPTTLSLLILSGLAWIRRR